jgi:lysophospholipase L1-like esterase
MKKILLISTLALTALAVRAQVVCDTVLNRAQATPFTFAVPVADGNYRVTVTLGAKKRVGQTVVRAESRRHYFDVVTTKKGQFTDVSFTVNKHSPLIDQKAADAKLQEKAQHFNQGEVTLVRNVRLKSRELTYKNWDDSLNLSFCGPGPAVQRIRIEAVPVTTVFLCGNSTVVDQENEPWASWGQMITRWFTPDVAIANYAESGLSCTSFLAQLRLDKILTQLKKDDYVIVEFGHNDEKEKKPGDGAWYSYSRNLKIFVDRVRQAGGHIIFCTPTARRFFEHGHIKNTHGEYPEAMKTVARREHVPVIDLTQMSTTFYEALGEEGSKRALVHYPANTFADQPKPLADNTHFNPYGAWEIAKMVVMGLKAIDSPLVQHLRADWQDFAPAQPDDPNAFTWYTSAGAVLVKPDGN